MDSATEASHKSTRKRHCPFCGNVQVLRQHRSGVVDYSLALFGLFPYACAECKRNFRAYRSRKQPNESQTKLGVVCPRCAANKSVRIPSEKVTPSIGNYLWRKLGIPGYRCPECRMRFFSIRKPVRSPE